MQLCFNPKTSPKPTMWMKWMEMPKTSPRTMKRMERMKMKLMRRINQRTSLKTWFDTCDRDL
jgi:hypothetical protein